ncbi:hypothetical protein SERLA73DRAFT_105158 [Serpula lacrymans var. lacrymans S7.3]|uniref:J domain-containing protein n=2 Tax=Serpula lacrymans var. lacrymans TaxID=341189 RepID=F8PSL5_SERL3|nr:uncharacterized protein SERLADRAFT_360667 [Serpula lacrymans var. lacrymans S7.9]EGO00774.1 hypothetical protein SERLA73DRAFT_105158 [Serpula lacrymans var. lacrymans S7.3]EGO26337.1 hypothetical protein SERLADRAFT_360667 [Serpula lacrymans var. lacrymans S7.9]
MSTQALLGFAGWSYLPDLVTVQVLRVFHYTFYTAFNRPPPVPRTPVYASQYRFAFAGVVLCYLSYNLLEASRSLAPNFYELLGVYPDTNENMLKLAFRAFAKKNHPDRVGSQGEDVFIQVRDAFEALKDPVIRFAYDKFGPEVLKWKDCTTMREYLRRGLLSSSPYHIMTGMGLFVFSAIGRPSPIALWRYLLFIALLASELYLILTPSLFSPEPIDDLFVDSVSPSRMVLHALFPRRTVYQHILLLHQLFFFMSVALSRVVPILFPSLVQGELGMDPQAARKLSERLVGLIKATDRELSTMLNIELSSVEGLRPTPSSNLPSSSREKIPEEFLGVLSREMEKMIIENKLKTEVGPLQKAWQSAVNKGKKTNGSSPLGLDHRSTHAPRARSRSL